jgi:hypothetical protein
MRGSILFACPSYPLAFMPVAKLVIVAGGQTGADRAAQDFALAHAVPYDGWCPAGRRAEDGAIDLRYCLRETPSSSYMERTEWNVRDSDGTVVLAIERPLRGGTRLTVDLARRYERPLLVLIEQELPLWGTAASTRELARRLVDFIEEHAIERLNVAGPRLSQQPRIGHFVTSVLSAAWGLRI